MEIFGAVELFDPHKKQNAVARIVGNADHLFFQYLRM